MNLFIAIPFLLTLAIAASIAAIVIRLHLQASTTITSIQVFVPESVRQQHLRNTQRRRLRPDHKGRA